MSNFYKKTELTEQEQEVDWAIDAHRDAMKDEMQTAVVATILWVVSLALVLFSPEDSRAERVGSGLFLCAALCFVVHLALGFRTRKYRNSAKVLVDKYMRDKAVPFYQELVEMFAEKKDIHLHLNDNGSITVTDRRQVTQGEGEING